MRSLLLAPVLVATTGCFMDVPDVRPAMVAGRYEVLVRGDKNGCMFPGLDPTNDPSVQDGRVELSLYQDADDKRIVTGLPEGLLAATFWLWLGAAEIRGTLDGDALSMQVFSPKAQQSKSCTYTLIVLAEAKVRGQTLVDGDVRYRPQMTSNHPDCMPLVGCETTQTFRGTRTGLPTRPVDGGM